MSVLWVRHATSSPSVARRSVLDALTEAGVADDDADDAALITSELVGNAIQHASPLPSGGVAIRWSLGQGFYTISVTDGGNRHDDTPGGGEPDGAVIQATQPSATATSGRGLSIVQAIASEWGVERTPGRTTVWARRELTEPQREPTVSRPLSLIG